MTLHQEASGTNVFDWLLTAGSLQLDDLRDECIDALGTYLLPDFHQHLAFNMDKIKQLQLNLCGTLLHWPAGLQRL